MLMLPGRAVAAPAEWRLALRNIHTGETVDALFARSGQFLPQGLAELAHGMRDWRTGEAFAMDRQLLALLVNLRQTLGQPGNKAFDLISGYRSPATNGALKAAGGAHSGVASKSQHMLGKASDIHLPGIALDRLRSAAMALGRGGVGYYPKDGFVHVDTGRVRHW
ncbi:DUF882 domain-containing protein [Sphingomonas sp. 28-63-12]|uniref:DUF882 domain-containing protein n=1 Tax=Sphingomonas sp. 28-63-12 TaxID=1970434 RepID=UPI0035A8FBEF